MAEYRFLTTWVVEAPRERVFEAIHDSAKWPSWWKGVEDAVELEPGDADGVGSLSRYTWKSKLPYRLEFEVRVDTVDRPRLLEGRAVGELAGEGRWRFIEQDGITVVLYEWNVTMTELWMRLLSPLLKPVFAWNHDVVMRQGGQGLAALLGTKLLVQG